MSVVDLNDKRRLLREKTRKWRAEHPDQWKRLAARNNERHRINLKPLLQQFRNVPCLDCGQNYPIECMEFDHRDPRMKKNDIGSLVYGSVERLLTEIGKCDVVCANCHRIRTARRGSQMTNKKIERVSAVG